MGSSKASLNPFPGTREAAQLGSKEPPQCWGRASSFPAEWSCSPGWRPRIAPSGSCPQGALPSSLLTSNCDLPGATVLTAVAWPSVPPFCSESNLLIWTSGLQALSTPQHQQPFCKGSAGAWASLQAVQSPCWQEGARPVLLLPQAGFPSSREPQ